MSLVQSVIDSRSPLVLLLYGTHGSEMPGSLYVARRLATAIQVANPHACTEILGPVSPWSCRHAYRFDRYLGDPNRVFQENQVSVRELVSFFWLWQKHKPKTYKGLGVFYQETDRIGLCLENVFQSVQIQFRGLPGYVHQGLQQRRHSYLLKVILRKFMTDSYTSIILIDVHTGIGPNAHTCVFYDRRFNNAKKTYLVDSLAAGLETSTNLPVQAMITETGVINNGSGMTDALSELALRTHGFHERVNLQIAGMDTHWQYQVDQHLQLQLSV